MKTQVGMTSPSAQEAVLLKHSAESTTFDQNVFLQATYKMSER